jgi:tRNA threonylcarbamoyl adenosine modification protein (Sua5/YciO/YrdC/YwlC family)
MAKALRLDIPPFDTPSKRKIERAAAILDEGGVAAYPTDSIYALGCALEAKKAADRIQRARQMSDRQRLALLCPDLSTASNYGRFSQRAFQLARQIFPGPYTLVVPATRETPRILLDKKRRAVGIRIPDHPVAQALLHALGRPILTSSAIPPGEEDACRDADELIEAFGQHLDVVVDSGLIEGEPSTVLEAQDDEITLIREGAGPLPSLD